jgi:hypothetical protein
MYELCMYALLYLETNYNYCIYVMISNRTYTHTSIRHNITLKSARVGIKHKIEKYLHVPWY